MVDNMTPLEPKHWARMWAKAWLDEAYREQLETDPARAARDALAEDKRYSGEIRLCNLEDIDNRYDQAFSRLDRTELQAIFERRSPRRIVTPSEWIFGNYVINSTLNRDVSPDQRAIHAGSGKSPADSWARLEPWESAAAQWDRVYAFIYYHAKAGDLSYKHLFETNPQQALAQIAPHIGITFAPGNDHIIKIGDSPIGNGLQEKDIVEIRDDPDARGVRYIARLSC